MAVSLVVERREEDGDGVMREEEEEEQSSTKNFKMFRKKVLLCSQFWGLYTHDTKNLSGYFLSVGEANMWQECWTGTVHLITQPGTTEMECRYQ